VRRFNEGIARMVTLVDGCGLSKDIKLICNTFIWDLIVEFYRGTIFFFFNCNTLSWVTATLFSRAVGRKENEATYLIYCNIFIDLHRHCLGGDLVNK
jgi:hypothetical protein